MEGINLEITVGGLSHVLLSKYVPKTEIERAPDAETGAQSLVYQTQAMYVKENNFDLDALHSNMVVRLTGATITGGVVAVLPAYSVTVTNESNASIDLATKLAALNPDLKIIGNNYSLAKGTSCMLQITQCVDDSAAPYDPANVSIYVQCIN